jgi:hypothetical protein
VKLPKGEARELPAVQTVITQADGSIEVHGRNDGRQPDAQVGDPDTRNGRSLVSPSVNYRGGPLDSVASGIAM